MINSLTNINKIKQLQFCYKNKQNKLQQHNDKTQNSNHIYASNILSSSYYIANFMPLNFRGTKMYNVNLIDKVNEKFIPAVCTQLDFQDDANVIKEIEKSWSGMKNTDYIDGIIQTFKDKKGTFITVSIDDKTKPFSENIKSIIKTDIEEDTMFIDFLQSSPDIADNPQSKIRGAGELAIYTAVKEAKEKRLTKIELTSGSAISNHFYDKIGFECNDIYYEHNGKNDKGELIVNGGCYELPIEKFDSFITRIEKKYAIKK